MDCSLIIMTRHGKVLLLGRLFLFSFSSVDRVILHTKVVGTTLCRYANRIGVFKLSLTFQNDYPNSAPTVKFVTRVFHPNGI